MNIDKLLNELTIEEKASLCSGHDAWRTKVVDRLGIPSVTMSDGPHGLRAQRKAEEGESQDDVSQNDNIPATAFPAACLTACSFDVDLLEEEGKAIGEEARAEGINVVLGPASNIKRSPLCGRNFEYFSEDPYLSSKLSAAWIKGLQSEGVGASLKHFACNNQEYRRFTIDETVDEKTLREIYLAAFEGAIKEAKPWTVMCAYNKINGEFCSENEYLLKDVLRSDWGYDGLVVSDWGAVNDRPKGVSAGLDLEMPSSGGRNDAEIVKAVKEGRLSEDALDFAVKNVLALVQKVLDNFKPLDGYDIKKHHDIAVKIAEESAVLLKNVDEILPVEDSENLLIVGEFAEKPRFAGGGSSHVTPTIKDDILSHFKKAKYAKGYAIDDDDSNNSLIQEAATAAKKAKKVILFIGLPDSIESESFDREDIEIPENQLNLVYALCMQNRNLAVVLFNGSPVNVSWEAGAKAILEMYLPGQGGGTAIFNLLTGKANPCGLLAESFPEELSHNPSHLNFPLSSGKKDSVTYAEGENVGYRYYRKKSIDTAFNFGEGLSYSSFSYSDFKIDESSDDEAKVSFTIKNDGPYDGKKTILLFVERLALENEFQVELEHIALRKFQKVFLKNDESKEITFYLGKRDFSEYDLASKGFEIRGGKYAIRIQTTKKESSSPLSETLTLPPSFALPLKITQNTCWEELLENEGTRKIAKPIFDELRAYELKDAEKGDAEGITVAMREAGLKEAPLRLLRNQHGFSQEKLDSFINELKEAVK